MESTLTPDECLLSLSREMLQCATSGDWDQLTKLEQSRLPLFNEIFAQGISGRIALAREVLALDEQTQSLVQAQMPVLQQAILLMQTSGKANTAYQTIQDSTSGNDGIR
ncbi:MAG: flagellar protein FliT [Gammaproteobacteria bacterium]|nr:flagellar protein FliT [Gammaproteobacteria bacterium]